MPAAPRGSRHPVRTLSLLDCIALGINGIIGSGVYSLLAPLVRRAGAASVVGVLACGLLCILIALCFAELAGMFDRSGGSYIYAREAFGPRVGFGVGWMGLANGVLGFAAVAVAFADALGTLIPALPRQIPLPGVTVGGRGLVAVGLVVALGLINYLGVKAGARTSDLLSLVKLLPLVGLALLGLPSVRLRGLAGVFSAPVPVPVAPGQGGSWPAAVAGSAFLATFMLSGFEYTAVPAGEVKNPRRDIPRALVGSLAGATLLYCLLLVVALSVLPDLPARGEPLLDLAGALLGPVGRSMLGGAALVSMAGFCAGSALVGPRALTALAEDGHLPPALAGLSRFGTPGPAILLTTAAAALLAMGWSYASLVDIANVAIFGQYVPTCLAVLVLRRRMPTAERFLRLPGGPAVPLLATLASVLLLTMAGPDGREWRFSLEVLALGAGVWGLTSRGRRSGAGAKTAPPSSNSW